ncbi:MAG TPA: Crp/Fnr family transcriptional regulator [Acidobacteriaceae bacterium]|jgi:CRP-like cAMP-binding protein
MPEGPYRNTLLRHLDPAIVKRLKLKHTMLETGRELVAASGPVDHIYFLEEGIASMTNVFKNGNEVEVGTFGYDSVVGLSALLGAKLSPTRVFLQIAGHGFAASAHAAKAEFAEHGPFQELVLMHAQSQFAQAAQNAACNAVHKHEQRMARWLLICGDRIGRDVLDLSHEFLAHMLGSTRSTVTITAGVLKRKGAIDHSRGCIRILNREKLQTIACECYGVFKAQLDGLTEGLVGRTH